MDINNSNNYNNNAYNNQPNNYNYPPMLHPTGSNFATAAMILGLLAIATTMIFPIYLPFIFGSLSILFALLSKGNVPTLSGKAITGIISGAVGIGINMAIIIAAFFLILSKPKLMIDTAKTYDDMIEQMYGVPSEEILGESMEDMMRDIFFYYD